MSRTENNNNKRCHKDVDESVDLSSSFDVDNFNYTFGTLGNQKLNQARQKVSLAFLNIYSFAVIQLLFLEPSGAKIPDWACLNLNGFVVNFKELINGKFGNCFTRLMFWHIWTICVPCSGLLFAGGLRSFSFIRPSYQPSRLHFPGADFVKLFLSDKKLACLPLSFPFCRNIKTKLTLERSLL